MSYAGGDAWYEKLCGGCLKRKKMVSSFPSRSLTSTSNVLKFVQNDVMGPMQKISKGGARHVWSFVDDHSRYLVA